MKNYKLFLLNMIKEYIKLALVALCIISIGSTVVYLIRSEQKKASLQVKNAELTIDNKTLNDSFDTQKKISQDYNELIRNEQKQQIETAKLKTNINKKTTEQLILARECELINFQDTFVICD